MTKLGSTWYGLADPWGFRSSWNSTICVVARERSNTSKKEKASIFVKDLAVLLNHHWIRDEEVFEHERLRLFPPFAGGSKPRIVLEVNLAHIKRSGGESDPKHFAFREEYMLLYDPLIPIMAIAFADCAFLNIFTGPEDIYKLVVLANSDRLRLHWHGEWLKRPVFRDVEESEQGLRVALDNVLVYSKEGRHLIRLGRSIGLAKALEW
ncbi:hypothetical protein NOR_02745 [Metarhizium rileyi]|uniref:Uncharacterized protein n=1 Tax=Metarhizium rileyi (strain RCEF 4871) TaxID=1649241 RepID=A0A167GUD1_METRR|nr:hypothetical protein NOR_02745 [Metarhizium rileyi RCEF 4871]